MAMDGDNGRNPDVAILFAKRVAPPFKDRFRYFLSKLRFLLPIPNRFIDERAKRFVVGLRLVSGNEKEEIYEKENLLYVVPKGRDFRINLFRLIHHINLKSQYQEPPVVVEEGDIVID
jgi:hypothetical protein